MTGVDRRRRLGLGVPHIEGEAVNRIWDLAPQCQEGGRQRSGRAALVEEGRAFAQLLEG